MCGRYAITTPLEAMERLFNFEGQLINMPPRYNVAPTQDVPIVRHEDGARRLAMVRWGLVPHWSKEMPRDKPLINARGETVAQKPSFRTSYRAKRCLVLADGFYEWQRAGQKPLPFYISPADGGMFAMAGVWDVWKAPDGETVASVAIVTTAANDTMSSIHHRMPVVIAQSDIDAWLTITGEDTEAADVLIRSAPEDYFAIRPVSSAVNKVANDGPELLEPADHAEEVSQKKPPDQLSLL